MKFEVLSLVNERFILNGEDKRFIVQPLRFNGEVLRFIVQPLRFSDEVLRFTVQPLRFNGEDKRFIVQPRRFKFQLRNSSNGRIEDDFGDGKVAFNF